MTPFKNKTLWNIFVGLLMMPAMFLAGIIFFGLISGILGIPYMIFDGWAMFIFSLGLSLYSFYKIFTGGFDEKGVK